MSTISNASKIITEPLTLEQARPVYALMREVLPDLTLSAWLGYARRVLAQRSPGRRGVIVARRQNTPLLLGAVCYERTSDVRPTAVLRAEHFVAVDLLYPEAVLAALVKALDATATALGCSEVRSVVHGDFPGLAEDLQACGHDYEGVVLAKRVSTAPETADP